jgi:hypothetical protein
VGLERGPLNLVNTTEELLEIKKIAAAVYKTKNTAVGTLGADHAIPSNLKSLH